MNTRERGGMVFSSQLEELARVRSFVAEFCETFGASRWSEESIDQIRLAVHETACNIIKHACGENPRERIRMEMELERDHLSVTFYHGGVSFDPKKVSAPALDGLRESGYGLFIIRNCVDDVTYSCDKNGVNAVCLAKNMNQRKSERI